MKKYFFISVLFLIFLNFLGAQTRSNSVFEGIWDSNDDGSIIHFIFINDNLILINSRNGEIFIGTFTYNNRIIEFSAKMFFSGITWETAPGGNIIMNMEYVFSGNNLIIVINGYPISLKKIEWNKKSPNGI